MVRIVIWAFAFFFSALFSGCAVTGGVSPNEKALLELDSAMTGSQQTLPAVANIGGEPAVLYASKDHRVVFQLKGKKQLLDETAPVKGGNGFQLRVAGSRILALWWSHEDAKNLYSVVSTDGGQHFSNVEIVNTAHGVLPQYDVFVGDSGTWGVSYLDERKSFYQAYFNRSTGSGVDWMRPDTRLDLPPSDSKPSRVQDIHGVQLGSNWFVFWIDAAVDAAKRDYQIIVRRSTDAGLTWEPPVALYSSAKFLSALTVRATGKNVVVAADALDVGIVALSSSDIGLSWRQVAVLDGTKVEANKTEGASNSGLALALTARNGHLLWTQDRPGKKAKIMQATLSLETGQWNGTAAALYVKEFENTRSISPSIFTTEQGTVWASWVDYSGIRPDVYLSTTLDDGAHWTAPKAMNKPGSMSAGWPSLVPWREGAALVYEIYPTDKQSQGKVIVKELPTGDVAKGIQGYVDAVDGVGIAAKKSRLEERVNALWKFRLAGNYDAAYGFFDFAYRGEISQRTYVESAGVITYDEYKIEDLSVQGNEAVAKMRVKYHVSPTPLPSGKIIKLAPTEADVPGTWVWIENDWFLIYNAAFAQPSLTY